MCYTTLMIVRMARHRIRTSVGHICPSAEIPVIFLSSDAGDLITLATKYPKGTVMTEMAIAMGEVTIERGIWVPG